MHARVGATGPKAPRLVQRLRALTPTWAITRREARWVAEQQAKLLLAETGITAPPVPERIVTGLHGVTVYPLAQVPVKGLMGVSKPTSRGGDILIDSNLPQTEQRVTLLHELKHIIDGSHAAKARHANNRTRSEGLCTDFALSVLMPGTWLYADWLAGNRDLTLLAERYQVPIHDMAHRLHILGLSQGTPHRHQHPPRCQWQLHTDNTEERRNAQ